MYQQTPEKDLTTYAKYLIRVSNQTSQVGFDYAYEGLRADREVYTWNVWAYIDVANRVACQMVKCAKETDGLPTAVKRCHIANVSAYQKMAVCVSGIQRIRWKKAVLRRHYWNKTPGRFSGNLLRSIARALAQGHELVPLLEVYRAVPTEQN